MRGTTKRAASDSIAQRSAECTALTRLAGDLGLPDLKPNQRLQIGLAAVCLDGFHAGTSSVTLLEINAHIGKMKTATRNKVIKDAFKMLFVSQEMDQTWRGKSIRRILVFLDQEALDSFGKKSWALAAFNKMGIETYVCQHLTSANRKALQVAQQRQDLRFTNTTVANIQNP